MNSTDSLTVGQLATRLKSLFASAKAFRERKNRPLVRVVGRAVDERVERQLELDLWR